MNVICIHGSRYFQTPFEKFQTLYEFGTMLSGNWSLCDQSFLNESAYSADESNVKVLFKYPSTTFVYAKT